jgi:hypothetical protein
MQRVASPQCIHSSGRQALSSPLSREKHDGELQRGIDQVQDGLATLERSIAEERLRS